LVKNCGYNVNGTAGTINAPNYPNSYGNNQYCEWYITSPPGSIITVTVATLTEYFYDRVFILRPATCTPPVGMVGINYISGDMSLYSFGMGANTAMVAFYSDSSVVAPGFTVTWSAYPV
jgi:hypothetical protein